MKCKNGHIISGNYCQVCEEKPEEKKVYKIKKISKRKAKELVEYLEVRKIYLTFKPYCERCGKGSTDIHHMKGRGKYLSDIQYFMAVCRICHTWIEEHPKESKELNYTLNRN